MLAASGQGEVEAGVIVEWQGKRPQVATDVFLAPTAVLIGDVTIGPGASVWYGAVLRGDFGSIVVGQGANIQDNVVVHTAEEQPTIVGDNATVGHGAVIEACTIEASAVIGINAVVLNGACVGERSLVAAGSVVPERMQVPPRQLVAGAPAVVKKELSGRSLEWVGMAAPDYRELAAAYRVAGLGDAAS